MPAGLNHGLNRFKPEGGLNLPTLEIGVCRRRLGDRGVQETVGRSGRAGDGWATSFSTDGRVTQY